MVLDALVLACSGLIELCRELFTAPATETPLQEFACALAVCAGKTFRFNSGTPSCADGDFNRVHPAPPTWTVSLIEPALGDLPSRPHGRRTSQNDRMTGPARP